MFGYHIRKTGCRYEHTRFYSKMPQNEFSKILTAIDLVRDRNMAASIAKSCIENYVTGFNDSSANDIANYISDKSLSLTELIEYLGVYLTSSEVSTRARATRCITDTLQHLSLEAISENQVGLLCTFLCEKLKDHHSIHSFALSGILILSKSAHASGGVIDGMCRLLFKEIHAQSLPQADRRTVYTILTEILTSHLKDVLEMGTDFVYGFIQVMDGEKDPRNLVLAFHCANIIINNFSLGVFVEEMFEVVSCYFPIDFTPSASDPSGIKKEDLIKSLRGCMAATPQFAQHCLPLLMEKLTSDLKSAKIDSLETLAMCAQSYGAENLQGLQSSFFNCIKKEMFLSGDSTLEEAALTALKSLVKTLSTGVSQSDKKVSLEGFVEEILAECKNHLLQPELMLMLSSGRLLQSVAVASEPACIMVIKATVPLLLESFNRQDQPSPRHNVLTVLNGFMKCTSIAITPKKGYSHPVLPAYKDHLLTVYSQSLADSVPSIQVVAVEGLHILLSLPSDCLLRTERSFIAAKLVSKATENDVDPVCRDKCTAVLEYCLREYVGDVQEVVLPTILDNLQLEHMDTDGQSVSHVTNAQLLDILAAITVGKTTIAIVMDKLCRMAQEEGAVEDLQMTTLCISRIARKNSPDEDCQKLLCDTGVKCILDLVKTNRNSSMWRKKLTDEVVLSNMAAFLRHLMIHCQQELLSEIQTMFLNTFLTPSQSSNGDVNTSFSPLQCCHDAVFTALLTPVLCSRPQQESIPRLSDVLDRLIELIIQPLESLSCINVCKCLAALINKHPPDQSLDTCLSRLENQMSPKISSTVVEPVAMATESQKQTVQAWAWISKALILRGHPQAKVWVNKLLKLLGSSTLGTLAAQGVHVILTDYDDVLNKEMRANIKFLYRQRFFLENLDQLVTGYNSTSKDCQLQYLTTLSHCIQGLNKQVLVSQLPVVYPLLIKSLLSGDLDLQLATMVTLGDLIDAAPGIVDKHVDSLIPQLLSLTTYKPSMKVRVSALKCLGQVTVLPIHVVMPYRSKVVRSLLPVLDDKKRLVRAGAVDARQRWILLDSAHK